MRHDAAVTVRLPAGLKRRIEIRAREGQRSLSAQVVHDLTAAAEAGAPSASRRGRFLGLFSGARVPTDAALRDVRVRLWGRLGGRTRRA